MNMLSIVDLRAELPRHATRRWKHRSPLDVDYFTVHHQAGTSSIHNVALYHISPNNHIDKGGCPGICYHYAIDIDGIIYQLNNEEDVVYSSGKVKASRFPCRLNLKNGSSANDKSISIILQGDFDGEGHKGFSGDPTEEQVRALVRLRSHLLDKHNLAPETFLGHCHVNKRGCPGFTTQKILETLWDKPAIWFVPEPEELIQHIQEIFRNIILAPIRSI